ncbi:MAG: hypothetical protein KDA87_16800, partial [Planctomycetales bacterium]|nr:hypothetical protein [Planctomycetales bacterium]
MDSIRALVRLLFMRIEIPVWLAIFLLQPASLSMGASERFEQPLNSQKPVVIRFEEEIGSLSEQYLYRKLDAAAEANADLIILEIDSPGGRLDCMERMIQRIQDSPVPVVAYVPRQALSAAAIMSLACDEIVMSGKAVFGDAGPIFLDEGFMFQHASEKIRTDLARKVRDFAAYSHRPPALAEAMVDMNLIVYKVQNTRTNETTYMSDSEIESSDNPAEWEKLQPVHESREDHFLEVNGIRAVELGLADANALNRQDMLARFGFQGEPQVLERTGVDTAVLILNNPFMTGFLFVLGLIALYVELASPGIGVGGLVSILCFGLFFWSRFLGGTAEWLEVILFVSGLALIGVEIFVIPGFGFWGLTGLLLMGTGLVLAGQDFVFPQTDQQWNSVGRSLGVLSVAGVCVMAGAWALTTYFG